MEAKELEIYTDYRLSFQEASLNTREKKAVAKQLLEDYLVFPRTVYLRLFIRKENQ